MLGGNLIVVAGSVRWTGNLPDRADVAARGGAEAARGQNGNNFEPRVEVPIRLCSIALDSSGLDLLIGTARLSRLLAAEILVALDVGQ
jgi:hypothetical protein